ncbi:MAG: LamG-like jellyroll fold domain-containing protein [Candidatus Micrarchaeia archaeon]
MRLQLSLEFMIVLAFVLLVFVFMFALISSERAVSINSQMFSQLQLIAQNIASQISSAYRAGNGFRSTIPMVSSIGNAQYNVTITKSGEVIVSATVGKQIIQALAYSNTNIVSNPSFSPSSASSTYILPISNGTISLQNSQGNICVDYNCPNTTNLVGSIALSSKVAHAAQFNGENTYIEAPASSAYSFNGPQVTVAFWIYPIPSPYWGASGNYWENAVSVYPTTACTGGGSGTGYNFFIESGGNPPTESWTADNVRDFPGQPLVPYKWQMFVGVANSTYINVYYNGKQIGTPVAISGATAFTTPPTIRISGSNIASSGPGCNPISGDLADVQIYNTALSANQIQALYQEGINGTPIVPRNLVGWWPLDGNANDYSGAGDNGAISGPIIFPTVAQITAQVLNQYGTPLKNALVGFATDLGTFSNGLGSGQSAAAYTDSNGIASVLLTQQNASGYADVKAAAFNFVSPIESNVVAWYPLDFGTGNAVYDISGNGNNGAMNGQPYWNFPKYVSRFNGNNSQIQIQPTVALNSTTFTVNLWVRPLLYGNAGDHVSTPDTNGYSSVIAGHGYTGMWWFEFRDNNQLNFYVGNTVSGSYATPTITNAFPELGQWYMLTGTYSPSAGIIKLYINGGSEVATATSSIIPGGGSPIIISGSNPAQTTGGYFKGDIANMQIYNTVLSPSQIQQLYQSGIAALPISNAGLIGWWPLDGNANDYSGAGNSGTAHKITYTLLDNYTRDSIFIAETPNVLPIPGIMSCDNLAQCTNSSLPHLYLSNMPLEFNQGRFQTANFSLDVSSWIYSHAVIVPNGANTVTITAWIKPRTIQGDSTYAGIVRIDGNAGTGTGLLLSLQGSSGYPSMATWGNDFVPTSGPKVNYNQWNFLAVRINGTDQALLYVNGQAESGTLSDSLVPSLKYGGYSTNFSIGSTDSPGRLFNGSIANVQVYLSPLSVKNLSGLYARGIEGVPLSNQNLVGWWPLDGNANDYSGSAHNGTAVNVNYPFFSGQYNLSGLSTVSSVANEWQAIGIPS